MLLLVLGRIRLIFFVLFYCILFFPCFWSSVLLSEIASKMSPNDAYQLLYGLLPHPQEFFCVTYRILQNVMPPSDIVIQDLTLFPSEYACKPDAMSWAHSCKPSGEANVARNWGHQLLSKQFLKVGKLVL